MPGFGLLKPSVDRLERRRDVQGLIKLVSETHDAAVAAEAVDALGGLGDASAAPFLVACAGNSTLRVNAQLALRRLGRSAFLPVMLDQRRDRPAMTRVDALAVLVDIGRAAPELPVAVLLSHHASDSASGLSADDRLLAAEILGTLTSLPPDCPPAIAEIYERLATEAQTADALLDVIQSDPDGPVRVAAARSLAAAHDPRAPGAIYALAAGNWTGIDCRRCDVSELRIDLCRVLLEIGDRRAEQVLLTVCRWNDSACDLLVRSARDHGGLGPELEGRLVALIREADAEREAAATASNNSYQDQQAFYFRSDIARRLARILAACGPAYTGDDEIGSMVRRDGGV